MRILGKKRYMLCLLACLFVWTGSFTAFAKGISKVKLKFSGTTPVADATLGSISCSGSTGYYVTSCQYTNPYDTWEAGDIPVVEVQLQADTNYVFNRSNASYFSLSGMGAKFASCEKDDDGKGMTLTVTLKKVQNGEHYDLDEPENLDWNNKTALWSTVQNANSYDLEVKLDGGSVVGALNTRQTSANLSQYITRDGDYSFRVRAVRGNNKGNWSDESDVVTFTGINDGGGKSDGGKTPGTPGGGGDDGSGQKDKDDKKKNPPNTLGWNMSAGGWWYLDSDGTFPTNGWKQINNRWYFFDVNGFRQTGWILHENLYYYLGEDGALYQNTVTPDGHRVNADGVRIFSTNQDVSISTSIPKGHVQENKGWRYYDADGRFAVSTWKLINGKWYYFDAQGYSETGWHLENGLYYYLGKDGALLVNTMTPDGHVVNEDGVMIK